MVSKREQDVVDKVIRVHEYHDEQWADRIEAIEKNNSMVQGDQWDQKVKDRLKKQGRPCPTINIEYPFVAQLLGTQQRNPRSWRAYPVDDYGDDQTAEIVTKLLLHIAASNNLDQLDQQWFQAGIIGSIGWVYIDYDYDNDPMGELRVTLDSNVDVLVDPDAKDITNQRDWKRVIRRRWMSWDDIRFTWPEKVKEKTFNVPFLERQWDNLKTRLKPSLRGKSMSGLIDVHNEMCRVVELWERKKRRIYRMSNPYAGDMRQSVLTEHEVKELVKEGWRYDSSGVDYYLELSIVLPYASRQLESVQLPYKLYPFAGYFPIPLSDLPLADCISYTENLHGVQETKNRMTAVIQDILQKAGTRDIIFPEGEEELQREYQAHGSEPGWAGVRKHSDGAIEMLRAELPTAWQHALMYNDIDIQRVSGQPLAQRGESESSEESGRLMQLKLEQGVTTMGPMFSNFAIARRLEAMILLERIQKDYTQERVFRILGDDGRTESFGINQFNIIDGVNRVLNDVTIGRYDISIADEPFAMSQRDYDSRELDTLLQRMSPQMVDILAPEIVENSRLTNRREIAQKLRDATQQQQQQQATMTAGQGQGQQQNLQG